MSDLCSGVETVPWRGSCSVCLYMAEGGTHFGKTPSKGVIFFWGGYTLFLGRIHFSGGLILKRRNDRMGRVVHPRKKQCKTQGNIDNLMHGFHPIVHPMRSLLPSSILPSTHTNINTAHDSFAPHPHPGSQGASVGPWWDAPLACGHARHRCTNTYCIVRRNQSSYMTPAFSGSPFLTIGRNPYGDITPSQGVRGK